MLPNTEYRWISTIWIIWIELALVNNKRKQVTVHLLGQATIERWIVESHALVEKKNETLYKFMFFSRGFPTKNVKSNLVKESKPSERKFENEKGSIIRKLLDFK